MNKDTMKDAQKIMTTAYSILTKGEAEKQDPEALAELGQKAMDLISDYPLYVGGISNITYAEAIGIAMFFYGDIEKEWAKTQETDKAMALYTEYVQNFDKACGEPVCFGEWFDNEYQELKKGN